jgi:hypothetical protein
MAATEERKNIRNGDALPRKARSRSEMPAFLVEKVKHSCEKVIRKVYVCEEHTDYM